MCPRMKINVKLNLQELKSTLPMAAALRRRHFLAFHSDLRGDMLPDAAACRLVATLA